MQGGHKSKSHVFLQIPKDSGPFQVDKAAYQESNLRKEEGRVPRNQRWSCSHLKCPSNKSGELVASQYHILSIISVMVIKHQNRTKQAERDEKGEILRAKSAFGANKTLHWSQTPEARPCVLTSDSHTPTSYHCCSTSRLRFGQSTALQEQACSSPIVYFSPDFMPPLGTEGSPGRRQLQAPLPAEHGPPPKGLLASLQSRKASTFVSPGWDEGEFRFSQQSLFFLSSHLSSHPAPLHSCSQQSGKMQP